MDAQFQNKGSNSETEYSSDEDSEEMLNTPGQKRKRSGSLSPEPLAADQEILEPGPIGQEVNLSI